MITLLAYVPLLGGLIAYIFWARSVTPPLPIWNITLILSGALLFLIVSFLAFNRVRIERDNLKIELKNKEGIMNRLKSEIDKINDESIRNFTSQVVEATPENSWRLPSSRDHHMKDECGEWGNLLHTLRVIKICDTFADILNLPQLQMDILKSAAILHDSCKHGVDAEAVFIYKEHPQLVQKLVEKTGLECNPLIMDCIGQHMGKWGRVIPNWNSGLITLPFLLHAADCIEARLDQLIK